MEESVYSTVAEEAEEEAPPPPPPRAESLTKAPARPLPAIPASASLGTKFFSNNYTPYNSNKCLTLNGPRKIRIFTGFKKKKKQQHS